MAIQIDAAKPETEAARTVRELIKRARAAQQAYARYTQAQLDEVVTAAGWAIINPGHNRVLAELAVKDTGLGNVSDKIVKNHRKTLGLLRDLQGAKSTGVIAEYPARGITEIARPVGVVAAIVPSTNPAASPRAHSPATLLLKYVHAELRRIGAPVDLVQQLPAPVTRELTNELMRQADLV